MINTIKLQKHKIYSVTCQHTFFVCVYFELYVVCETAIEEFSLVTKVNTHLLLMFGP